MFLSTKKPKPPGPSMSFKFSKIDYEKQCRVIQDMKAMNPNRRNYGDPSTNELDFQVYTLPYKNKIKQDAKNLVVSVETQAETPSLSQETASSRCVAQRKQTKDIKMPLEYDPNEFYGDELMVPQLPRLLHLH